MIQPRSAGIESSRADAIAPMLFQLAPAHITQSARYVKHVLSGGLMDYHEFVYEQPDMIEQGASIRTN